MFMYCGVVWGIGWVLHVYVLWCGVGYRTGVTCLCIVERCGVLDGCYMFMYCGVVWGIGWVLHV